MSLQLNVTKTKYMITDFRKCTHTQEITSIMSEGMCLIIEISQNNY